MPQMQLPLFSEEVMLINSTIGYAKRGDTVYYFNGQMPVYSHHEKDEESFKVYMSQLYVNGTASQAEINRAFGMNPINMKRWVTCYKQKGPAGFYRKERRRRGHVLTVAKKAEARRMLDEGRGRSEIAAVLGLKSNTLGAGIRGGRLHEPVGVKKTRDAGVTSTAVAKKI